MVGVSVSTDSLLSQVASVLSPELHVALESFTDIANFSTSITTGRSMYVYSKSSGRFLRTVSICKAATSVKVWAIFPPSHATSHEVRVDISALRTHFLSPQFVRLSCGLESADNPFEVLIVIAGMFRWGTGRAPR